MFVEHKEQGEAVPVKVGTLKLSEAIRIGARLRPKQCRGAFFQDGASCAMGAAYEAITGKALRYGSQDGGDLLGVVPHYDDYGLRFQIASKNDSGNHTREQIADWLEQQGK